ncbi:MAG: hypothetical protein H6Q69_489 [Firmicutes bacterium]|nr:hypothetical protein [Bacillota bacterium]
MSFKDFLETYKIAGWGWELFKGLLPMFIALLTIYFNEKREHKKIFNQEKKEEHQKLINKNQRKYDELKADLYIIEEKAISLSSLIWDTGKELLDAIQHSGSNEGDRLLQEFITYNKKMLVYARQLCAYADIKTAMYGEKEIVFLPIFEQISKYAEELIDIMDSYNARAAKTPLNQRDILLDDIQKEMIECTQKVEDKLIWYCISLDDLLKKRVV